MENAKLDPTFCDDCGLIIWHTWPDMIACDTEDLGVEHECNPNEH